MTDFFKFFIGKVDLEELITAFHELGVAMDRQEATNLLKRYIEQIFILIIIF